MSPERTRHIAALTPFVGRWLWRGASKADDFHVDGWAEHEALDDGHFLLERWELTANGDFNSGIAIIGLDTTERNSFKAQCFDSHGRRGSYTIAIAGPDCVNRL